MARLLQLRGGMRVSLPVLAILVAVVSLAAPRARACAACSCGDPTLSVVGTERPFAGRLRLSTELRVGRTFDGPLEAPNVVDDARLALGVAYAPTDRFILSAQAPIAWKHRSLGAIATQQAAGVGDLDLGVRAVLWQERSFAPRLLTGLRGGVVVPTGPELARDDGRPISLDVQPGMGAFVPRASAWAAVARAPLSIFVAVDGYAPMAGFGGFRPGAAVVASSMLQLQPLPYVAARGGLDLRVRGDDAWSGEAMVGTGGVDVAAHAGVAIEARTDLVIALDVAVPAFAWTKRGERAGPFASLALLWDAG